MSNLQELTISTEQHTNHDDTAPVITPDPSHIVVPSNTSLSSDFYKGFELQQHYVALTDAPSSPIRDDDTETPLPSLFDDLHDNHDVYTNRDLMYEVLYQCHSYVPEWNAIPFEIFCHMVHFSSLTGGYTNLLYCVTLHPEYLTQDDVERCPSLQSLLSNIEHGVSVDDNVTLYIAPYTKDHQQVKEFLQTFTLPSINRVALRIYGTNEFSNRTCELAMAQLASIHNLSEIVYCSWRHGRITSFLDGASVGCSRWMDPIVFTHVAYLQGRLHAYDFKSLFDHSTLPPPDFSEAHLLRTLRSWCDKAVCAKIYRQVRKLTKSSSSSSISELDQVHQQPQPQLQDKPSTSSFPSVFDLFNDPSNELYVLHRPPVEHLHSHVHDTRVSTLVLPLPPTLAPMLLSMLNAYHLQPFSSDYIKKTYDLPSNALIASTLTEKPIHNILHHEIDIVKTEGDRHVMESIVRFIDVPRMKQEVEWLAEISHGFYLTTGHNDFHSGNIMALNSYHDNTAISPKAKDIPLTECNPDVFTHQPVDQPYLSSPLPTRCLEQLKVIDFEYGGYNYRGFDIANSLNEAWIDYDGLFPGFSIDCPHMISTHLLGVYNHEQFTATYAKYKQEKQLQAQCNHTQHDHTFSPYYVYCDKNGVMNSDISVDRIHESEQFMNQRDSDEINSHIQRILLSIHGSTGIPDTLDHNDHRIPSFRPRDVVWAHSYLIGHYYTKYHDQLTSCKGQGGPDAAESADALSNPIPTLDEYLETETPQLLYEAMVMQLASLLLWALWGIIMSDTTHIQGFGYLEHSIERMVAYVAKKELLIKLNLLKK